MAFCPDNPSITSLEFAKGCDPEVGSFDALSPHWAQAVKQMKIASDVAVAYPHRRAVPARPQAGLCIGQPRAGIDLRFNLIAVLLFLERLRGGDGTGITGVRVGGHTKLARTI